MQTFKRINVADIKALTVLYPPKPEQDAIVDYIESRIDKIDALNAAYARQLALLAEYRASLIHECVTGQREVPEAASFLTLALPGGEGEMEGHVHAL